MTEQITYLLANYNNGKYIRDCIASLQAQTSPHWRCLIADDQSTDDSLAIIQPLLCDKIRLFINAQNIGYTRTLMRLLEVAATDIVGILDPDDALYPEATELILQAYQAHSAAGLVYSNYDFYSEDLKTRLGLGLSAVIHKRSTSLLYGFLGPLKSFRRTVYAKTAGLDPTLLYAEDRDLAYKMEEVTSLVFVDRALYKYRTVPHSQSHDRQKQRLGEKHHRRAYHNALMRRQIRGRAKLGYLLCLYSRQLGHWSWRHSREIENASLLRRTLQALLHKLQTTVEKQAVSLIAAADDQGPFMMIRTRRMAMHGPRSTRLTSPSLLYQRASKILLKVAPLLPSERKYNLSLCHAKKFIWFRVAKVATRTIFQIFDDANVMLDADHAMACHYPVKLYHDYFKFAFVRNPWDRLVSCWHSKVVEQNLFKFDPETRGRMQNFGCFVDYMVANRRLVQRDAHLCPQSELIDLNQLDYLGRFEHLETDLAEVMQIVGLGQLTIPHQNASQNRRDYHTYYDEALRQKVAEIYQKDIRLFSYKF